MWQSSPAFLLFHILDKYIHGLADEGLSNLQIKDGDVLADSGNVHPPCIRLADSRGFKQLGMILSRRRVSEPRVLSVQHMRLVCVRLRKIGSFAAMDMSTKISCLYCDHAQQHVKLCSNPKFADNKHCPEGLRLMRMALIWCGCKTKVIWVTPTMNLEARLPGEMFWLA